LPHERGERHRLDRETELSFADDVGAEADRESELRADAASREIGRLAEPRADLEATVERRGAELARDARNGHDRGVAGERVLVTGRKRQLEPRRDGERLWTRSAEGGTRETVSRADARVAQGAVGNRGRALRRQRRDAEPGSVRGDGQRDSGVELFAETEGE